MNKILSGYAQGNYFSADVNMDRRLMYVSTNGHYYYVIGQQDDLLSTYRLPDGSIMSHPMDDSAEAAFMIMDVDTDAVYGVQPLGISKAAAMEQCRKNPDYYMGHLMDAYEKTDRNMSADAMEYRVIGTLYDNSYDSADYRKLDSVEYEHRVASYEYNEKAAQKWLLENHAERWFGASFIPVKPDAAAYNNPVPGYYEARYGTKDRDELLKNIARDMGVETLGFSDGRKLEAVKPDAPFCIVTYQEDGMEVPVVLESGGSYNIQNADDVMAREVLHMMADMRMDVHDDKGRLIGSDRLFNVPEYSQIRQDIAAGADICAKGEPIHPARPELGSVMSFKFDGSAHEVTKSYSGGRFEAKGCFKIKEIESENVRFIPVENFVQPHDNSVTVQRFYAKPFTSESEAKKALADMGLHDMTNVNTSKSMIIADINEIKNTDWYKDNMACISMVEDNGLSWDNDFDIWAPTHRARLAEQMPDNVKSIDDRIVGNLGMLHVDNKNVLATVHAIEDFVKYHTDYVKNMSSCTDTQAVHHAELARDNAVKERDRFRDSILPGAKFDMSQIPVAGYTELGTKQTGSTSVRSHASANVSLERFNKWLADTGRLEAVRIGSYGLTKDDTKSKYYDKQDYYKGIINEGTAAEKFVSFKRVVDGNTLSDKDCEAVLLGEAVSIGNLHDKDGSLYDGYGVLVPKSFVTKGRKVNYYGIDTVRSKSDALAKRESAATGEAVKSDKPAARFFSNKYGTKYCSGEWNGSEVKFKPVFKDGAVNEDDCKKLLAGETVRLVHHDLSGECTSVCQLANMTYTDRKTGRKVSYTGIKELQRTYPDGSVVDCTKQGRGHEFDNMFDAQGQEASGPSFD